MALMVVVALTFTTNNHASDHGHQEYSGILPRTQKSRIDYTFGPCFFVLFSSPSLPPPLFSCCGQVQGPGWFWANFSVFFLFYFSSSDL
ncbi:hypothetical protein BKA57DRAFT_457301 [Linnemannia elongata]|nr:hypothetical protein BKA57DRAFT_457301 [Linnemannia elongata]